MVPTPLVLGVAERAYPGETLSGDAWQVDRSGDTSRIAVIDGLGHGELAAQAAQTALAVLAHHPELNAADSLHACHRAMHSTRGAAMWVATVEVQRARLTYAGVGNVDARLSQDGREQRLTPQRGIVGATMPNLRPFERTLEPGWLLLVYTDGIRDRFDLGALPEPTRYDLTAFAKGILQTWARTNDDALILVAQANPDRVLEPGRTVEEPPRAPTG